MDKHKTGQLIKERRLEKNLTQEMLATKVGVTNKAVSRWENGSSFPDVGLLDSLSKILDLTIAELVLGEYQEVMAEQSALTELASEARSQRDAKSKKIHNALLLTLLTLIQLLVLFFISCLFVFYLLNSEPTIDEALFTLACLIAIVLILLFKFAFPGIGIFLCGYLLNNHRPKKKITRILLTIFLIICILWFALSSFTIIQAFLL